MILNLKIFLDILMFTRGPQDLPSTSNFLTTIILINIIVGLISVDPNISYTINIFFAVIYIVVTLLFIKICLGIHSSAKILYPYVCDVYLNCELCTYTVLDPICPDVLMEYRTQPSPVPGMWQIRNRNSKRANGSHLCIPV